MKGLILSGGKGTRLYPLTYKRAKQLIPVANTPVLVRVIETIRDAGITEIGIVTGDTGAEIEAVLEKLDLGVSLTYIPQDSPDGLAHAVKISREFLGDDRFVMFLGDNVIQGGISNLITQFAEGDWNCQIVLKSVGMDKASLYGIAQLHDDGSIEQLIEKPKEPPTDLALVGIYMFDSNIFKAVEEIKPSWRNEFEITDAIQWLIDNEYTVYPHVHEGWWIDTGKSTEMLVANDHVLEELVPSISPDAIIENSQVDSRVTVEAGAKVINSTIRGPAIIGKNTMIKDSYVGPFTSIYYDAIIEDCEIEHSIALEECKIISPGMRVQDSLIGRAAKLTGSTRKPRALKMNLGDYSTIWLPKQQ